MLTLLFGLAMVAPLAAMATVKNVHQQQQQLRVKPQPSSSSGLPVPDLLESPDAKYDPKPKDIDAAALRLRLKGELSPISAARPFATTLRPLLLLFFSSSPLLQQQHAFAALYSTRAG